MTLVIVAEHLAVAIHNARLAEQSQRVAVLEERQRLARELHDNVTQVLSSISLMAQSLSAAWRKDPADGERRAERLRELAQMAFEEMRALLRELTPGDEISALARAARRCRRWPASCWSSTGSLRR